MSYLPTGNGQSPFFVMQHATKQGSVLCVIVCYGALQCRHIYLPLKMKSNAPVTKRAQEKWAPKRWRPIHQGCTGAAPSYPCIRPPNLYAGHRMHGLGFFFFKHVINARGSRLQKWWAPSAEHCALSLPSYVTIANEYTLLSHRSPSRPIRKQVLRSD